MTLAMGSYDLRWVKSRFAVVYGIKRRRRRPWPSPREIASMYLFLCVTEMRHYHALSCLTTPERYVTDEVREHLGIKTIGVGADDVQFL